MAQDAIAVRAFQTCTFLVGAAQPSARFDNLDCSFLRATDRSPRPRSQKKRGRNYAASRRVFASKSTLSFHHQDRVPILPVEIVLGLDCGVSELRV